MSNPTQLHKPYLVKPFTAGSYELTIAADNSVPTELDASVYNVQFAPLSGVRANVNRFGALVVMIAGVFTGSDRVNANCQVGLWQWSEEGADWVSPNCVPIVGSAVSTGSLTLGSMGEVRTDPASRRGYLEVTGLAANQILTMTVTKVQ